MKTAKQVIAKLKRETSRRVAQEIGNRIGELLCAKCPTLLTDSEAKLCPECLAKDGVHFDREESEQLRELAAYCMRGYMGEHAHTVKMILAKVPR